MNGRSFPYRPNPAAPQQPRQQFQQQPPQHPEPPAPPAHPAQPEQLQQQPQQRSQQLQASMQPPQYFVPPPPPQHAQPQPNSNSSYYPSPYQPKQDLDARIPDPHSSNASSASNPNDAPSSTYQSSSATLGAENGFMQSSFPTSSSYFQPAQKNFSAPLQSNTSSAYPTAYIPPPTQHTPSIPHPPVPQGVADKPDVSSSAARQSDFAYQPSFYTPGAQNAYQQNHPPPPHMPQGNPSQPMPQVPQASQPIHNAMQSAVPFMMAGLQQMTNQANGADANAFGAQLLQTFAPGAAGYTNNIIGQGQEKVKSFMRMPKYYFAVNNRYVLRKLLLILVPFRNRTWGRQRGMNQDAFDGTGGDGAVSYLPPRDDVNAPDLYIPVMAFLTYVLVVGYVFGTRNAFKAEVLANYFSKGLGVLTMEVLVIKLGLYLINARPTPWLDVIAYRGYKFVGVVLTIMLGLLLPKLYVPTLLYSATAMGIFLMRSHRRIILPRDVDMNQAQDLARRNAFLLFVCVFQYPIYWILARIVNVKS